MNARVTSSLLFMLAVALIVAVASLAQEGPKTAVPVPAVAKLCGNFIVPHERKAAAFQRIQAEGCEDIRFVHIAGGRWLSYGTKVLIGEGDEK